MDRAFDVAVFFTVSPADVLRLDLAAFLRWEVQAWRIVDARAARGEGA